jgi:hypothetical protein
MSHADKTILVSGATGKQGGALLKYLLGDEWRIRALTRNPRGRTAQDLSKSGVEVVQEDMEDLESLKRAMKGVHGVYSVQDFWTVGARREVLQGKNMADAARSAGVEHLLYSSVGGAERNSGITHWETKWEVENYIRKLGLPVTVLRPAAFMENYYIAAVEIGILKGKLADPIRGDKAFQTMRLTTSAPSERWLLIGQMILSVSSWKLREASSPTFKRRKCSVACWGNELNFRRCLGRSSASFWERNSTRCFVGSTNPDFRLTFQL